jgi:hypothetical protein
MTHIVDQDAYERGAKRAIIANANKTFHRTYERASEVECWLEMARDDKFWSQNEFAMSVANTMAHCGKVTEGQYNAICKIIDKQAARQAEWDAKREADKNAQNATLEHVGVVGERMQFELKVVAVIEFDRPKFHYYDSGVGYITIMEDDAGNKVVYMNTLSEKTKDEHGYEDWILAEKGDTVLFMAKVKEHGVRDGAKQTVVQRPTKTVVIKGE